MIVDIVVGTVGQCMYYLASDLANRHPSRFCLKPQQDPIAYNTILSSRHCLSRTKMFTSNANFQGFARNSKSRIQKAPAFLGALGLPPCYGVQHVHALRSSL